MTMELFSTAKEQYKILSTSGRSTHKKKKSKQESQNMREHAICQIHIKNGIILECSVYPILTYAVKIYIICFLHPKI